MQIVPFLLTFPMQKFQSRGPVLVNWVQREPNHIIDAPIISITDVGDQDGLVGAQNIQGV